MASGEDILRALAAKQASEFNSSPFSQSVNKRIVNPVVEALMAPGNALNGAYNQVEIEPSGYVRPFNSPLMDAASNMAGVVSLGAAPMPRPQGSLNMGVKMFHGSPDPRWLDAGEAFSSANPVTAPSKYMFGSPKRSVADTYAGTSEMQMWKAQEGMGPYPASTAGVRQIELKEGSRILKIRDVNKLPPELGVSWGGTDSLERVLDAAKSLGYYAVQMLPDGGSYAVLNSDAIKKVSIPR